MIFIVRDKSVYFRSIVRCGLGYVKSVEGLLVFEGIVREYASGNYDNVFR